MQYSFLLQFFDRGRIGFVLIHVDHSWRLIFGGLQHFAEEPFGGSRVSFALSMKSIVRPVESNGCDPSDTVTGKLEKLNRQSEIS